MVLTSSTICHAARKRSSCPISFQKSRSKERSISEAFISLAICIRGLFIVVIGRQVHGSQFRVYGIAIFFFTLCALCFTRRLCGGFTRRLCGGFIRRLCGGFTRRLCGGLCVRHLLFFSRPSRYERDSSSRSSEDGKKSALL